MIEITLQGPAKNALGTPMMTSLRDQLTTAGDRPVLLTGVADAFSAGLNLVEVASLDARGMEAFLRLLQDVVSQLFHHPAPTVACVNGHAIAGGAILALACDHTVATSHPGARIGLNEVALGLRFPPRLLAMVRHRLPPHTAAQVLLGAGLHAPEQALALGLVDELAEDPLQAARARLEALAAHPPLAYQATKADLRGQVGVADPHAEAAFLEEVLPMWTSDALRQRIQGFLRRR